MEFNKQNLLRILLTIIALDYIIIGFYSALVPNSFGETPLIYSQISIIVGLFTLVVSSDVEKYQNFLWIVVLQEIGEVSVNIVMENPIFIPIVHSVYLVALILLIGRSIIPNFRNTANS